MKYILSLCITLFLFSCGRYIPNEIEDGKLLGIIPMQHGRGSYQITQRLQASREDIFRQARRWAAFHVPNPSQALAIGDNLMGDIITYGSITGTSLNDSRSLLILPNLEYAASIECYENSYRVTLTNFQMLGQIAIHPIEIRHSSIKKRKAKLQYQEIDKRVTNILATIDEFVRSELKGLPVN